jgi:hypothetical protein
VATILRRYGQFVLGACVAGGVFYGALGLLGAVMPGTSRTLASNVLGAGLLLGLLWHAFRGDQLFPWPRRQIRREMAHHPRYGMVVYGAVLGVGVLTLVTTPLVWVGALGVVTSGSPIVGAVYGLGFGLGRAAVLGTQYTLQRARPERGSPALPHQTRVIRVLGAVGLLVLGSGYALSLWR